MFPIRTVSEITGVNSVTLRAWERRYGLIQPQRTPKGHRLYNEENIADIKAILHLLAQGVAISHVRGILQKNNSSEEKASFSQEDPWAYYLKQTLEAIHQFDEFALEQIYNGVLALYPIDLVTRRLLLPLLELLGTRWEQKQGSIAEEHFFSMYIRNKLGAQLHHQPKRSKNPLLLGACFPGEHHVLGLLLFALAAHQQGYRMILLGTDLPFKEIPPILTRTSVDAIVLSSSTLQDLEQHRSALNALIEKTRIPCFVGGKGATKHWHAFKAMGAIPVGEDLKIGLERIQISLLHKPSSAKRRP